MRKPIRARFKRTKVTKVDPANPDHSKYYAEGEEYFQENYYDYGYYFNPIESQYYAKEQLDTGRDDRGNPTYQMAIAPVSQHLAEIAIDNGDHYQMAVDYLHNIEIVSKEMDNYLRLLWK